MLPALANSIAFAILLAELTFWLFLALCFWKIVKASEQISIWLGHIASELRAKRLMEENRRA
jgi:hypothetical protein